MKRVIVCGGRDFDNQALVERTLSHYVGRGDIVIEGGATGADQYASAWAKANGVYTETYPADWKKHGKSAGPIRNREMLNRGADLVIAFPGGRGTADMVMIARKFGVEVIQTVQAGQNAGR